MQIGTKFNKETFRKENLAVFFALLLIGGFMGARALLSLATLLLGLNGLRGLPLRDWPRNRMWLGALLWWLCYVISFFWSQNNAEWGERVQVKLPFLLLPLAIMAPHQFEKKHWNVLAAGLMLLFVGGVSFSLSFLLREPGGLLERYGRSYVFRTPAYNDHISFSAAVAVTVIFLLAIWKQLIRPIKKAAGLTVFVLIAYLHILAAKTGLVMMYSFLGLVLLRLLIKKSFQKFALIATLIVVVSTALWHSIPTVRARYHYVRYSLEQYKSGQAAGNYSDPARLYSYEVALNLIREKPLTGYGAGSVVNAMNEGYNRWEPHVATENRLVPHNQFLASGVAAGLFSVMGLFIWWLAFPVAILRRKGGRFYPLAFWAVQSLLLYIDPTFEVQMGVVLFLFYQYWFRQLPSRL